MRKQHETAVLVISDLHIGKKTADFNITVARRRLNKLAEKVCRIKEQLGNGYELDNIHVWMLGDTIDGDGIYPGQPHHQDESNVTEQTFIASEMLGDFLAMLGEGFPRVVVTGVPGNHGRVGRHSHEAANWDLSTYRQLEIHRTKNVRLNFPNRQERVNRTTDFIHHVNLRSHGYLLYHGHGVRSFANIPFYGLYNRALRWRTSTRLPEFCMLCCGHFHTLGKHQVNDVRLMLTGTMVTSDDWALQQLGFDSANKWWLFGVSNRYPQTWQFDLDLV
jgi:hypothetical protein